MVQFSNNDYPHRMLRQCSHVNEIIGHINRENVKLKTEEPVAELQPGRVNLTTNQIRLGFTCSDQDSDIKAAQAIQVANPTDKEESQVYVPQAYQTLTRSGDGMMMNQRNVERLLDTLENSYTKPITVSLIQLPQRSGSSADGTRKDKGQDQGQSQRGIDESENDAGISVISVPTTSSTNGNVCTAGLVPLPNLSTRMLDFIHSRSINCIVELQTVERYMRIYQTEYARLQELDKLHAEMERRNVRKQSVAERIGVTGNEAESLFNLHEFLLPFGQKYKKHVFLVLIMCYLQLGAVVSVPLSCMWESTQIPKVPKPELPPMTPQPINPALVSKKKKKLSLIHI